MDKIYQFLGGKCAICGGGKPFQVDHKDRASKKYTIGRGWHKKWGELVKELQKCQLLCEKCHIKKSVEERGQRLAKMTHGTLSSYRYCKCDICKKANSDYHRQKYKKSPSLV